MENLMFEEVCHIIVQHQAIERDSALFSQHLHQIGNIDQQIKTMLPKFQQRGTIKDYSKNEFVPNCCYCDKSHKRKQCPVCKNNL